MSIHFIQKEVAVLHYDIPPGTAHFFGNPLNMGFEPLMPFILPLSEN
jgi:hypothetical protein